MEFIKPNINIDFVGKRKIAYGASLLMILISLVSLIIHNGPRYGIDFAGGALIQIKFSAPVEIDAIKKGLADSDLGTPVVQQIGEKKDYEYLIRTDKFVAASGEFTSNLKNSLKSSTHADADIQRVETVGPQVGSDLREKALFAIFYALLFIAIYISGRFELKWLKSGVIAAALIGSVYFLSRFKVGIPVLILVAFVISLILFWQFNLKFAMGAVVALIHDIIITIGAFSLFDKEFTLPTIAAILTIAGYSLNDTIIVFDRIRENLRKSAKTDWETVINRSVNETLSRTILTSGTTLITVIALLVLGGTIIHDFAFAMAVGIVIGTYSSIYVASPILLAWEGKTRRR